MAQARRHTIRSKHRALGAAAEAWASLDPGASLSRVPTSGVRAESPEVPLGAAHRPVD